MKPSKDTEPANKNSTPPEKKILGKIIKSNLKQIKQDVKDSSSSISASKIVKTKPKSNSNGKEKLKNKYSDEKYLIVKSKSFDDQLKSLYKVKTIDKHNAFRVFFDFISCYDTMPASSKFLILDSKLPLRKSFQILTKVDVKVAMIWDSKQAKYIGLFSMTDFMHMGQFFYSKGLNLKNAVELDEWSLGKWKDTMSPSNKLISISPKDKAQTAIRLILDNQIRQVPVIDSRNGNVLDLFSHKKILNYIFRIIDQLPKPKFMKQSIEDLNIGTKWNVISIFGDQKLIEAWNLLLEHHKSSVPVLDRKHNVIGIYCKSDSIKILQTENFAALNKPIEDVLKYSDKWFSGVMSCRHNESLGSAMNKIVSNNIRSLVIVSQENHLVGILTLSDIMEFISRENVK